MREDVGGDGCSRWLRRYSRRLFESREKEKCRQQLRLPRGCAWIYQRRGIGKCVCLKKKNRRGRISKKREAAGSTSPRRHFPRIFLGRSVPPVTGRVPLSPRPSASPGWPATGGGGDRPPRARARLAPPTAPDARPRLRTTSRVYFPRWSLFRTWPNTVTGASCVIPHRPAAAHRELLANPSPHCPRAPTTSRGRGRRNQHGRHTPLPRALPINAPELVGDLPQSPS